MITPALRVQPRWVWLIAVATVGCGYAHAQAVSRLPSKKSPDKTPQAHITSANDGGISHWHVQNDHTLYIQGQDHQWYKAVLMSSCLGLPAAERVGFESNLDGTFDKQSAIRVGQQSCPLASLTKTPSVQDGRKPPAAAR